MNDKNISFEWNEEKNDLLKNTRNISFEDIILAIKEWKYKSLEWKELDEMKNFLQVWAKNTFDNLLERKAISIRVFKNDINKLKSIAYKEWIPYQTFITSTLHKVANGEIKM